MEPPSRGRDLRVHEGGHGGDTPWCARPPERPSRLLGRARGRARPAAALLLAAGAALATVTAMPPAASGAPPKYYVAIGASETLGFQGTGPRGHTRPTDQGYTNDLLAMEQARWPGLQLVLFACPGLRVDVALDGRTPNPPESIAAKTTSGACVQSAGSKVATASAFIRSHPGQVELVTLDLGYADVAACMKDQTVDSPCVTDALGRIRAALPAAVAQLRAAGGPSLRIVGLDHEDPSLAYYLGRPDPDPAFARASVRVTERFNEVVDAAYAGAGARVAHIGAAFATGALLPAHLAKWGKVPLDVERICSLTWVCTDSNIHPNTRGYHIIASTVAAALAPERRT